MGAFSSCEQYTLADESRGELVNATKRLLPKDPSSSSCQPLEARQPVLPAAELPPPPPQDTLTSIHTNEVLPPSTDDLKYDNLPPSHTLEWIPGYSSASCTLPVDQTPDQVEGNDVSCLPSAYTTTTAPNLIVDQLGPESRQRSQDKLPASEEEEVAVVQARASVDSTNGAAASNCMAEAKAEEGDDEKEQKVIAAAVDEKENAGPPNGDAAAVVMEPGPGRELVSDGAQHGASREAPAGRAAFRGGRPGQGQVRSSTPANAAAAAIGTSESMANAKLKAKEWQFQIKVEMKLLDKEIKRIQKEEGRLQKKITAQAQKGSTQEVEQLAKSIVQSRRAVARLEKTQSSMHAVDLHLSTAIASMSMKSSLQLSTELMREMNRLAQTEEVGSAVEAMHHEMSQCALEDAEGEEIAREADEQEEVDEEVQKVLEEVELAKIGLLESTKIGGAGSSQAAAHGASHARLLSGHGPRHRAA